MRAGKSLVNIVIALVIAGGLTILSYSSTWRLVEYTGFDLLTAFAPDPSINDLPIVIVGIDDPSFSDLNQQWPWPRSIHGQLVDALHRNGAAVIAFDVVFADPSTPDEDAAFASAIQNSGNVVLSGDIVVQQREQFDQVIQVDPIRELLDEVVTDLAFAVENHARNQAHLAVHKALEASSARLSDLNRQMSLLLESTGEGIFGVDRQGNSSGFAGTCR